MQSKLLDNGLILDSTCSDASRSWPRYADLRIDIRKEVRPDIVASAAYLPFKKELFGQIYCDPPHIIRADIENWDKWGHLKDQSYATNMKRFGCWKTKDAWLGFLARVNREFPRVLRQKGQLFFKVTNGMYPGSMTTSRRHLSLLSNFAVTKEKITHGKTPWSKKNTVHWLTLECNHTNPTKGDKREIRPLKEMLEKECSQCNRPAIVVINGLKVCEVHLNSYLKPIGEGLKRLVEST